MKYHIIARKDLEMIVNTFYDNIRKNEQLGNIFDKIMQVDWEKHLPKMHDFWENILFQTGQYKGRPFPPHVQVNEKIALTNEHFNTWLQLFGSTVDSLFTGSKANEIKLRASSIKEIFNSKLNYINDYKGKVETL
jgi:hemoglobin